MSNIWKIFKLSINAFWHTIIWYIIGFIALMLLVGSYPIMIGEIIGSSIIYFLIFYFIIWTIYRITYNYKLTTWSIILIIPLLVIGSWYGNMDIAVGIWAILLSGLLSWLLLSKITKKNRSKHILNSANNSKP